MSDEKLDVILLQTMVQAGAIKLVPVPALTSINKAGYLSQINKNVKVLQNALQAIRSCLKEAAQPEQKS